MHSYDGYCHCISKGAPARNSVINGSVTLNNDRYTLEDWQQIYQKDVAQRTAENFISASRLHKAGVGPKVIDIVFVRNFHAFYNQSPTWTCGIIIENLHRYPRKKTTAADEMKAAGVVPDQINSCIRQQIRGYVSDLNSVVGVMPQDAQVEIDLIKSELHGEVDCARALNPVQPPSNPEAVSPKFVSDL
ncbi:hypothetical protein GCM10007094_36620 [Pseudovibrio japonicus]|uniref:Uncharacterized protein n=1 Tax=Pseudovibrio japonicus TaxID=366534 RepID=A0ABQ3EP40_9HYPH|nr:hypothetical protein GCM10007094_36620 [Pseudovibrio japonicus]